MTRDDLISMLEKAEAGSRELDGLIDDHFSEWENLGGWWRRHKVSGKQERYSYVPPPAYSTSLDAAVALVAGRLPGWTYLLNNDRGNLADLFPPNWPDGKNFEAEASSMPLAITLATLKALEARDG